MLAVKWLSIAALLALSGCAVEPALAADLPTISEISCKRVRGYIRWYGAETVFGAVRSRGVDEETIRRKAAECRVVVPLPQDVWR